MQMLKQLEGLAPKHTKPTASVCIHDWQSQKWLIIPETGDRLIKAETGEMGHSRTIGTIAYTIAVSVGP